VQIPFAGPRYTSLASKQARPAGHTGSNVKTLLEVATVPAKSGWNWLVLIGKQSKVALARPFVMKAFAPQAMIQELVTGSFIFARQAAALQRAM